MMAMDMISEIETATAPHAWHLYQSNHHAANALRIESEYLRISRAEPCAVDRARALYDRRRGFMLAAVDRLESLGWADPDLAHLMRWGV